jgi:hypothetical protein
VRAKLFGNTLAADAFDAVVNDVALRRYTDVQLAVRGTSLRRSVRPRAGCVRRRRPVTVKPWSRIEPGA